MVGIFILVVSLLQQSSFAAPDDCDLRCWMRNLLIYIPEQTGIAIGWGFKADITKIKCTTLAMDTLGTDYEGRQISAHVSNISAVCTCTAHVSNSLIGVTGTATARVTEVGGELSLELSGVPSPHSVTRSLSSETPAPEHTFPSIASLHLCSLVVGHIEVDLFISGVPGFIENAIAGLVQSIIRGQLKDLSYQACNSTQDSVVVGLSQRLQAAAATIGEPVTCQTCSEGGKVWFTNASALSDLPGDGYSFAAPGRRRGAAVGLCVADAADCKRTCDYFGGAGEDGAGTCQCVSIPSGCHVPNASRAALHSLGRMAGWDSGAPEEQGATTCGPIPWPAADPEPAGPVLSLESRHSVRTVSARRDGAAHVEYPVHARLYGQPLLGFLGYFANQVIDIDLINTLVNAATGGSGGICLTADPLQPPQTPTPDPTVTAFPPFSGTTTDGSTATPAYTKTPGRPAPPCIHVPYLMSPIMNVTTPYGNVSLDMTRIVLSSLDNMRDRRVLSPDRPKPAADASDDNGDASFVIDDLFQARGGRDERAAHATSFAATLQRTIEALTAGAAINNDFIAGNGRVVLDAEVRVLVPATTDGKDLDPEIWAKEGGVLSAKNASLDEAFVFALDYDRAALHFSIAPALCNEGLQSFLDLRPPFYDGNLMKQPGCLIRLIDAHGIEFVSGWVDGSVRSATLSPTGNHPPNALEPIIDVAITRFVNFFFSVYDPFIGSLARHYTASLATERVTGEFRSAVALGIETYPCVWEQPPLEWKLHLTFIVVITSFFVACAFFIHRARRCRAQPAPLLAVMAALEMTTPQALLPAIVDTTVPLPNVLQRSSSRRRHNSRSRARQIAHGALVGGGVMEAVRDAEYNRQHAMLQRHQQRRAEQRRLLAEQDTAGQRSYGPTRGALPPDAALSVNLDSGIRETLEPVTPIGEQATLPRAHVPLGGQGVAVGVPVSDAPRFVAFDRFCRVVEVAARIQRAEARNCPSVVRRIVERIGPAAASNPQTADELQDIRDYVRSVKALGGGVGAQWLRSLGIPDGRDGVASPWDESGGDLGVISASGVMVVDRDGEEQYARLDGGTAIIAPGNTLTTAPPLRDASLIRQQGVHHVLSAENVAAAAAAAAADSVGAPHGGLGPAPLAPLGTGPGGLMTASERDAYTVAERRILAIRVSDDAHRFVVHSQRRAWGGSAAARSPTGRPLAIVQSDSMDFAVSSPRPPSSGYAKTDVPSAVPPELPLSEHVLLCGSLSSSFVFAGWVVHGLTFVLLLSLFFVAYSNTSPGASVYAWVRLTQPDGTVEYIRTPPSFDFSLVSSVRDMWNAGTYPLAIIVAVGSGIWPYVKLAVMLACWLAPPRRFPIWIRERTLQVLDWTGKWSLIDTYLLIIFLVTFNYTIPAAANLDAGTAAGAASLEVFVRPAMGVHVFVIGTILSLLCTHFLLWAHRRHEEVDSGVAFLASRLKATDRSTMSVYKACQTYSKSQSANWTMVATISLAIPVVAAALVWAVCVHSFDVTLTGIPSIIFPRMHPPIDPTREFSILQIGVSILLSNPPPVESYDFILIRLYGLFFLAVAIVLPLIHILSMAIVWFVPLTLHNQRRINHISGTLFAWATPEVLSVGIIASILQLKRFGGYITNDGCAPINELLDRVDPALWPTPDKHCVELDTRLRGGALVLFFVCLVYLIVSAAILAICERLVKRREMVAVDVLDTAEAVDVVNLDESRTLC